MELEAHDFGEVARREGMLFRTLLLPAILLPVLAFALARSLALRPHLTAGILLLNRIEFAVFAVVYFLAEVPLVLGLPGACRRWWGTAPWLPAQANTMTEIE